MSIGTGFAAKLRITDIHTFKSLKYRDFRLLWIGTVFFAAGNWIQQIAIGWLMYEETNSALLVGAVNGARTIPFLIVGPVAGVFSDRVDRRKMLLADQIFLATTSLLFAFGVATDHVKPWTMILFAFLSGAGFSIMNPLRQTIIANTVPRADVPNALALASSAFSFNRVLGPALGGIMIQYLGPTANFFMQGSCYLVVTLIILPMVPQPAPKAGRPETSAGADMREGVRYVLGNRGIFAIIMLAIIPSFFVMPFTTGLMPVFAKDALGQRADGLGWLMACFGGGGFVGVLILATFAGVGNRRAGHMTTQAVAGILAGLALVALSFMTSVPFAMLFLLAEGAATLSFGAMNNTHLQAMLPDHMRGRVMGIYMINVGLAPLGALIGGTIAEHYSVETAMLTGGLISVTLTAAICIAYRKVLWTEPAVIQAEAKDSAKGGGDG
ncbi:MAG: MFS transporter [Chloroflexi bacterium]|nr:MFS transporter [Chloroflexota bacterium]